MQEACRSLLLGDEDLEAKETRNPVAPAQPSAPAARAVTKRLEDGGPVHGLRTLREDFATLARN